MRRTFVAAVDAVIGERALSAAIRARTGLDQVHGLSDDGWQVAFTGPPPQARCLLDGTVDTLADIAAAAAVDPALAPEPLLAHAFARLGEELLTHLHGAFTLLLWRADGELLAVRDHLGDRGLVWTRAAGGVVLASEVADLLAVLAHTPGPDEVALGHWLAMGGMPEDRTLLAGVHRVRAGHLARIGAAGRVSTARWWLPPVPKADPPRLPREAAVAGLRCALELAVARALDDAGADHTGLLLSGGLDSSAVAALAGGRLRRTYSAVFPRFPDADETALIDATLDRLGVENVRVEMRGGGILAGALEYVTRWRLPPVSPNLCFWLPLLRRAAADGVEVLLDGQGGDELFGLSPFLLADRVRHGDVVGAVGLVGRVPGAAHRPPARAVADWVSRYGLRGALPPGIAATRRALRTPGLGAPEWLAPRLARAAVEVDPVEDWKRLGGPRWWAHQVSATADGPGPNLAYDHIRRRDALAGLASRHPLADPDVVEHVLSLPPDLAYHAAYNRPLLREAVAGLLPDGVRLRPSKSGFDAPFHAALAGPDHAAVQELLGAADAHTRAYTRPARVNELLLGAVPDRAPARQLWALHTWRLVTAELWLRELAGESAHVHGLARADVQFSERFVA